MAISGSKKLIGYVSVFVLTILMLGTTWSGCFLNRVRGGWETEHLDPDHKLGHDVANRMVMAVPYGFLTGFCTGNWFAGLWSYAATQGSLMIGWGSYFAMGNSEGCSGRTGVFDWLIGHQQCDWTFDHRWMRDFLGMSLRGLAWTAPAGVIPWFLGYGWQMCFSGIAMGAIYDLSWRIHPDIDPNFSHGTSIAECLWGMWLFFVLLISFGVYSVRPAPVLVQARAWPVYKYFFMLVSLLTDFYLIASCIMYGKIEDQQEDHRNWKESEWGLITSSLGFIVPQLVLIFLASCRKPHKPVDDLGVDPTSLIDQIMESEGNEYYMPAERNMRKSMYKEATKQKKPILNRLFNASWWVRDGRACWCCCSKDRRREEAKINDIDDPYSSDLRIMASGYNDDGSRNTRTSSVAEWFSPASKREKRTSSIYHHELNEESLGLNREGGLASPSGDNPFPSSQRKSCWRRIWVFWKAISGIDFYDTSAESEGFVHHHRPGSSSPGILFEEGAEPEDKQGYHYEDDPSGPHWARVRWWPGNWWGWRYFLSLISLVEILFLMSNIVLVIYVVASGSRH